MIRILDALAVRALLTMTDCIALMRRAMLSEAAGEAIQPMRDIVRSPDGSGLLGWMPGHVADPAWLGIKVVTVFERNFGTAIPSHQGAMLLFDATTGAPRAIIDASAITAIRTAAASAVATDLLAREDATTLALLGYGDQAESHLAAMGQVRHFSKVTVWGRDGDRARRFAADQSAKTNIEIVPVSLDDALTADVICAMTAAQEPYIEGARLRSGQHINLVGSSVPSAAEIDIEGVARARLFADCRANVLAHGGEVLVALKAAHIDENHVLGSIGDVIAGTIAGRRSPEDLTIFKSLGMIAEDIFAADHILAQAEVQSVGAMVPW